MSRTTLLTLIAALGTALAALPAMFFFYPVGIACVLAALMLAVLAIPGLEQNIDEHIFELDDLR